MNLRLLVSILGGFGIGRLGCVCWLHTQSGWSCLFGLFNFTLEQDSKCALLAAMLRMECTRLSDVLRSQVYPGPQPKHDCEKSQGRQERRLGVITLEKGDVPSSTDKQIYSRKPAVNHFMHSQIRRASPCCSWPRIARSGRRTVSRLRARPEISQEDLRITTKYIHDLG